MLKIENLTISSQGKVILDNVNFYIGQNETHLLLGPNGAGKTTFFKRIMGYKDNIDTKGYIFFDNINITDKEIHDIAKLKIFIAFQNPKSISGIKYGSFLREINKMFNNVKKENVFSDTRNIFNEMADKLQLDKSIYDRDLNVNLSGGELKKSELIQLALMRPKLCLIDEIDSGLDISSIYIVADILKKLQTDIGFSMIIISHNQNFIKQFDVQYVHIFKEGNLIHTGKKELIDVINEQGWGCDICTKFGIHCNKNI